MQYSKRAPLLIALAIPLLFMSAVTCVLISQRLLASPPAQEFIYTVGATYNDGFDYRVIDGTLTKVSRGNCPSTCSSSSSTRPLYRYDPKTNRSTEISITEAQQLKLDPSQQSRDGYRLIRGSRDRGFLLSMPAYDNSPMYLSGAGGQFEANLASDGTSSGYWNYQQVTLVGWIIS
ncbi:MAG: hypothetical protein J0M12_01180 [Deltaproteobacteria bacterium]|nr:hypothetical protein [Deltaproteobacteria bacterium]